MVFYEVFFITLGEGRKAGVFTHKLKSIHPETIDPFIDPELHDIIYFFTKSRVFPVQVWLLDGKEMQVISIGQ
jgi:hypothetical protein